MYDELIAYVQDDGTVIVKPELSFEKHAWENILGVIKKFKRIHGLTGMSNAWCLEMIIMDIGADIGQVPVEITPTKYMKLKNEDVRKSKRVDKSAAMDVYFHERLENGVHKFVVQNPITRHNHNVSWDSGWMCDCEDHAYRKTICKHIIAAKTYLSLIATDQIPNKQDEK